MRYLIPFLAIVTSAVALAQQPPSASQSTQMSAPYTPVVPAPSISSYGGGYYGGSGGGGGTVAGSSMRGMADVISAQGNYNLATSAAAVNMTQAQKQTIQNRGDATNTYFQMRQMNRQYRAAETGPPATMEQLTRMAKQGVPKPLTPSEVNPVTGQINWPTALGAEVFAPYREEVEKLAASRAKYGELGFSDQTKFRQLVNDMAQHLSARVQDVSPQDFTNGRSFLQRLLYSQTGAVLS
ncbi:MAG: hypothetical protein NTW96_15735 [Planctomycetia bacterium]|nr:hypothetical protein [Planctomycetia bacterium]